MKLTNAYKKEKVGASCSKVDNCGVVKKSSVYKENYY